MHLFSHLKSPLLEFFFAGKGNAVPRKADILVPPAAKWRLPHGVLAAERQEESKVPSTTLFHSLEVGSVRLFSTAGILLLLAL